MLEWSYLPSERRSYSNILHKHLIGYDGIQKQVNGIKDLLRKLVMAPHQHFSDTNLEHVHFSLVLEASGSYHSLMKPIAVT